MKTILVPVDFSRATHAVVAEAMALARVLPARVVLLHVILPPVVIAEYGALIDTIAEVRIAGEKAAARQLERLQKLLERRRIAVETRQCTGAVVPAIAREARDTKADCIVIGSHGHTALYDLFVGSTTHGVLRRARCPVLVVPPANRPEVREPRAKK